jgi:PAS domain S-box-containing protein
MKKPLRLFLVEDDENVADLIGRQLKRAGFQVTRCRSGADALIVLAQTSFDLVLLDHKLPDMDGLALLQRLHADGILAPVLMITARGDERLATQSLQAGALDYIVKDPALSFLDDLPKRAEASVQRHRLEQMNRLLVQALESARDGILITDLQGVILEVNQALEKQSGYARHELVGQTPRLFKSGAHPPELYTRMWQAIISRASWQGEVTNRRKDGSLYQVSLTISPIVDSQGRLTHFVAIQRDVTEHKLLEKQLLQAQKMHSVGTLAGGVAHEFNNLLAGINGYASLGVREAEAAPQLRQFFQHIVDLSQRAAGLTRQLLAFARKPALSRAPLSPADLLRATADLARRTLQVPVQLDLSGAGDAPMLVEADRNQLQQALINLALNARDALLSAQSNGAVTFALRRERLTSPQAAFPQTVPPGDYIVLSVRDEGGGMPPEVLQQALDPFFTTKEVGQGTGLGLPVVFGIVQGHNGHLALESGPGGTCASLYLPRLEAARAARPAPDFYDCPPLMEPEPSPRYRIAVADDEEAVLDVVRRFLEIAGHSVRCHSSGAALLRSLEEGDEPGLVLLDLMMPDEDASQTFASIRARRPGLPILLCTGRAEADPAPRLLQSPATGLLRKPFRMNELWYAVGQLAPGAVDQGASSPGARSSSPSGS